jgi:polyphosphate kinase
LRPGLPGISENIRVTSIVDRFLEHSRLYVFSPDDEAKVFLSSADWMPRNFHRRVEVMFPIEAPELKRRILQEVIPAYLSDNKRARVLLADGSYSRLQLAAGEKEHRVQEELLTVRDGLAERIASSTDNGAENGSDNGDSQPSGVGQAAKVVDA